MTFSSKRGSRHATILHGISRFYLQIKTGICRLHGGEALLGGRRNTRLNAKRATNQGSREGAAARQQPITGKQQEDARGEFRAGSPHPNPARPARSAGPRAFFPPPAAAPTHRGAVPLRTTRGVRAARPFPPENGGSQGSFGRASPPPSFPISLTRDRRARSPAPCPRPSPLSDWRKRPGGGRRLASVGARRGARRRSRTQRGQETIEPWPKRSGAAAARLAQPSPIPPPRSPSPPWRTRKVGLTARPRRRGLLLSALREALGLTPRPPSPASIGRRREECWRGSSGRGRYAGGGGRRASRGGRGAGPRAKRCELRGAEVGDNGGSRPRPWVYGSRPPPGRSADAACGRR